MNGIARDQGDHWTGFGRPTGHPWRYVTRWTNQKQTTLVTTFVLPLKNPLKSLTGRLWLANGLNCVLFYPEPEHVSDSCSYQKRHLWNFSHINLLNHITYFTMSVHSDKKTVRVGPLFILSTWPYSERTTFVFIDVWPQEERIGFSCLQGAHKTRCTDSAQSGAG